MIFRCCQILATTFLLLAAAPQAQAAWTGWMTITEVQAGINRINRSTVTLNASVSATEDGQTCTSSRVVVEDIDFYAGAERIWSVLMTAYAAHQEVKLLINGCDGTLPSFSTVVSRHPTS